MLNTIWIYLEQSKAKWAKIFMPCTSILVNPQFLQTLSNHVYPHQTIMSTCNQPLDARQLLAMKDVLIATDCNHQHPKNCEPVGFPLDSDPSPFDVFQPKTPVGRPVEEISGLHLWLARLLTCTNFRSQATKWIFH